MSNSDVVWNIVKRTSSFLRKNNGSELTTEPYNVLNVNSRKFSGLANKKAIGVNIVNGNVVLSKKRTKQSRYPSKSLLSMVLKKYKSSNGVRNELINSHYRADLADLALVRYRKLNKSLKKVKPVSHSGDAMQISKTN